MQQETTVALIDDHILLRNSLARVISSFEGFRVVLEADNGQHLIHQLGAIGPPDIALLDINMPEMDGFGTAQWLKEHFPKTKILVLSMLDNESHVIKMLNYGACGYITKDCKPAELNLALEHVRDKSFYSNELVNHTMIHFIKDKEVPQIADKERQFLIHACSELTYKEIAERMKTSPRTLDNYRDALFEKLGVRSRVGLVMYAIREGICLFTYKSGN